MTRATHERLLHHLRHLCATSGADTSDRRLLERFAGAGDEHAFAALVERHGPMVLGACRRVLDDPQDAEDAFQATFLVLARRAGAVRRRDTVGGFLYGVARRLALKLRAARACRRRHERRAAAARPAPPPADHACRELLAVLDEELQCLPEHLRAPLLACYLQGLGQDEAARQLGWSLSTLRRRLERGRERLRLRMVRRGATLSAGLFAGALAAHAAAALPAGALARATVRLAADFAAGRAAPTTAATLARGVVRAVWLGRLKSAVLVVLTAILVAGAGAWACGLRSVHPATEAEAAAPPAAPEQPPVAPRLLADLFGDPLPPGDDGKEADGDRIAGLIRQLGDDTFAKREAASKALEEIGVPALGALREAASSQDPEVRQRASRLMEAISVRLEVRRFEGHSDGVIAVALSPDGKLALSGPVCYTSQDSAARLWDVESGKELRRFEGHTGGVYAVAFSPDGKQALTAGDQTARLWDVATAKELKRLEGHTDHVYYAVYSPDGKSVLSGSVDTTLRLWDVQTGKELRRFEGHTAPARVVAFASDGKRVLSRGLFNDPLVRLWDVPTGKEVRRFDPPGIPAGTYGTVGIAFAPDGKLIAAAGQDNLIRLWDADTGKEVRRLEGHTAEADSVAFTPDGKRLVSGSEDQTIRIWDVASGKELYRLAGHKARVWSVACSADGRYILSGSFDKSVRLWRLPEPAGRPGGGAKPRPAGARQTGLPPANTSEGPGAGQGN